MSDEEREEEIREFELEEESSDDIAEALREAAESVENKASRRGSREVDASTQEGAPGEEELSDVAQLEAEIADLRDRTVRTLADFDNYRKRVERERQELQRYAAAEALKGFLEIVDNLERAVSAEGATEDLRAGVEMILRQSRDLLQRFGVHRVPAHGEPFDPAIHEAVSRTEDPEVAAPTITEELQPGYRIHDRLLRPAMVKVAVPADGEAGDGAEPAS